MLAAFEHAPTARGCRRARWGWSWKAACEVPVGAIATVRGAIPLTSRPSSERPTGRRWRARAAGEPDAAEALSVGQRWGTAARFRRARDPRSGWRAVTRRPPRRTGRGAHAAARARQALAGSLARRGARGFIFPALAIEPMAPTAALERRRPSAECDLAIFVSANAVEHGLALTSAPSWPRSVRRRSHRRSNRAGAAELRHRNTSSHHRSATTARGCWQRLRNCSR